MENIELPQALYSALGSESRDFAVRAGRLTPIRKSVSGILFGLIWLTFISLFILVFLSPGTSVRELAEGSTGNLASDIPVFLYVFFGVFILIGLFVLGSGIISLFRKGGYFVGTPQRLIHFRNNRIRSIDWEQFTGDIEIRGNERNGTISMVMRTGSMVSRGKSGSRYVPDMIYITGIPDVFEVEKICRRRIKENDPTPAAR